MQKIFDTIDETSRETLYSLVEQIQKYGIYPLDNWRYLKTKLNKEQLSVCKFIINKAE